jgi:hypothetical protein
LGLGCSTNNALPRQEYWPGYEATVTGIFQSVEFVPKSTQKLTQDSHYFVSSADLDIFQDFLGVLL